MDRTNPLLADDAVDALPLHHGRTELLEEIMNTPVLDQTRVSRPERSRSRYLAPLAAAAAVAALAGGTLWWSSQPTPDAGFAAAPDAPAEETPRYLPLLTSPGWVLEDVGPADDGGSVRYSKGSRDLEINWYPAQTYDSYVKDREHIVDPPAPGRPVEAMGLPGQLWAYSTDDHTTIRSVDDDRWYELRGGGMSRADYLDLLDRVALVDLETFEATMPDAFITTAERPAAVDAVVAGITDALAPEHGLTPDGTLTPAFATQASDRYYLGTDIAGAVACAWLDQYAVATSSGDDAAASDAVEAMATAREWPILQELAVEGDYPEVIWEYADQIAAGRAPEGFAGGLGCS